MDAAGEVSSTDRRGECAERTERQYVLNPVEGIAFIPKIGACPTGKRILTPATAHNLA